MNTQLELQKFDMSKTQGNISIILGRRNTGRSFLVKDLLYHQRDIPVGIVITETENGHQFYKQFMPELFIHNEYKTEIIDNVIKRQQEVLKQPNINQERFVVLDDCINNKWTQDKQMQYLFMNGRHWKITQLITSPFPQQMPPVLQANIDRIFILHETDIHKRRKIYETYAGIFPTFETFCQVMDQCTEDYGCLVIDNTSKSNELTGRVFWYRAEEHADFKMCSDEYHNFPDTIINNLEEIQKLLDKLKKIELTEQEKQTYKSVILEMEQRLNNFSNTF